MFVFLYKQIVHTRVLFDVIVMAMGVEFLEWSLSRARVGEVAMRLPVVEVRKVGPALYSATCLFLDSGLRSKFLTEMHGRFLSRRWSAQACLLQNRSWEMYGAFCQWYHFCTLPLQYNANHKLTNVRQSAAKSGRERSLPWSACFGPCRPALL